MNNYENTPMSPISNNNQSFSSAKSLNKKSAQCDEKMYLKYRNEELSKDVLEKMNEIHQLKEHVSNLEIAIQKYNMNFQTFNSQLSFGDSLKVDINILNKKISGLEAELNYNKVENLRLIDIVKNKDSLIAQFNNLVNLSADKFNLFQDTNQNLKDENRMLKSKIDDLNQIIISLNQKEKITLLNIEESKDAIMKKEKEIEKLENEMNKKEGNYRKWIEEFENESKIKMKAREEEFKNQFIKEMSATNSENEKLLIENEQLKLENKTLNRKKEDFDNDLQDKEFKLKNSLDAKDREYEKIVRNLKDLQRDIKESEFNNKEKIEEFKKVNKDLEGQEEFLRKQGLDKDKKIAEFWNEIAEKNSYLEELTKRLKESEITIENKENIIKAFKNENAEILKEFSKRSSDLEEYEEKSLKEIQILLNKIKILENEKEILFREKEEDHNNILHLRSKLNEFHEKYNNRLNYLEKEKENTFDRRSKEMFSSYSSKEDQYLNEISQFQNLIMERDKERDNLKIKYEKKIYSYKLKIEELEASIHHLVETMSSLKNWALSMETNISTNCDNYESFPNSFNYNCNFEDFEHQMSLFRSRNDCEQKKLLESLREIINKIDNKILCGHNY